MARWLVILAGGRGERFWPLSRMMHPKQFLTLTGNQSMIRNTRDRVRTLIDAEHTWVVTGQDYVEKVRKNLPDVPKSQILGEPLGRNTAPSIAWAAAQIQAIDPEATVLVLPSDHLIKKEKRFRGLVENALDALEKQGGFYTFGIVPTHAETGYGYIQREKASSPSGVMGIRKFIEKPPVEQAELMLDEGGYYWNSGMFLFGVNDLLAALHVHLPELYQGVQEIVADPSRLATIFPELPQISIDHGIMEKVHNAYVLEANIGWDDVGTFAALARHLPRNDEQNAARGHAIFVDSQNVTAISEGPVVSFIGVQDLFVVATKDAVLILSPDRSQDVREVVKALKEGQHEHLL